MWPGWFSVAPFFSFGVCYSQPVQIFRLFRFLITKQWHYLPIIYRRSIHLYILFATRTTKPNRTRSCKRKTVSARYKCGQKRKNPFQNAVCQIQFNFLSNRIFTFTFLFLLLLVALLVFSLCNNLMLFMLLLYHCSFHHFCFTDCRVQTVELCAIISSTNIVWMWKRSKRRGERTKNHLKMHFDCKSSGMQFTGIVHNLKCIC